ncbi:MAG: hypothetical protein V4479_08900 [Actinomycetota bacterium]
MSEDPYSSRRGWLGRIAAMAAGLCVLLEVAAIIVGNERHWTIATWLGYGVIGLTVVSFLGGLVAAILRRAGAWGVVAMIVSVLANPLVQIAVLGLFGSS